MRSDMDHSFTCKLHHACLYSPAAEHHRPLAGTHFNVPQRVEGWVDLDGWLHTEIKCRRRESNPDTVTHPSTNRAWRRVTLLIRPTPLPLRHAATVLALYHFTWLSLWITACSTMQWTVCDKQDKLSYLLTMQLSQQTYFTTPMKQGVALTGHNTTGPPSHSAPWWVTLHMRLL